MILWIYVLRKTRVILSADRRVAIWNYDLRKNLLTAWGP